MNIVIFSTDDFLHPAGGAERAIGDITERLPDVSFDLICARLRKGAARKEVVGNVVIHRIGLGIPLVDKLVLPFVGAYVAWRLVHTKKIDVFWTVMISFAPLAAYIHNSIHFWRKIPIIQTIQEGDSEEHIRYARGGLINTMWNYILSRADRVTVISSYLEELVRQYGFRGIIDRIPNGVDIGRFEQRNKEKEQYIRNTYGLNAYDTVLLTTSRLEEKNGVDTLIRSLEYLPQDTALLIVGDGRDRKKLTHLVGELGLTERVFFVGYLPHGEIPYYLHVSDIFVRPSRSEGMGNSFIEAMAAGIPVVGTPVGGIPDFLEDGETGFFSEPNNPQSVAQVVEKILSLSRDQKQTIIDSAKERIRTTYEWNTIAEQMKHTFDEVQKDATGILVLDAHLKGSLSIIRSLGKRGISVSAASKRRSACGLHSIFVSRKFTYSSPANLDAFYSDIKDILSSFDGEPVVYALSDATVLALARNAAIMERIQMLVPDPEEYARGFSKKETLNRAVELGIPVPKMFSYEDSKDLEHMDARFPLVVKPEHSFSWNDGKGVRGTVSIVHSVSELIAIVEDIHEASGEWPLIQEYINGEEYGVEFLYIDGEPHATCAHHRIRSLAPHGGASVVKESIDIPNDIGSLSEKLLNSLLWHGPAMVEWKRDRDGRPVLMEINGRFWGSLPLAVASGVDIPYMYYQIARGEKSEEAQYTPGIRSQHILGDIAHLLGVLGKKGYVEGEPYPRLLPTVRSFFFDLFTAQHDVWSFKDPLPALWEIIDHAGKIMRKS